jgi:hypothetical protein
VSAMSDLDLQLQALIQESREAKAAAKSKPPKPKADPLQELIIESLWKNESLVFVSLRQICACGAEHHSSQGLFLRQTNRRYSSRVIRTGWDHEDFRNLPRSTQETVEEIPVCHECFNVDQILAIFSENAQPLQLSLEV